MLPSNRDDYLGIAQIFPLMSDSNESPAECGALRSRGLLTGYRSHSGNGFALLPGFMVLCFFASAISW
jgi:hypothetical protein